MPWTPAALLQLNGAIAKMEKQLADNAAQRADLEAKLAQAKEGKQDSVRAQHMP